MPTIRLNKKFYTRKAIDANLEEIGRDKIGFVEDELYFVVTCDEEAVAEEFANICLANSK